jgi:hypothetical protein
MPGATTGEDKPVKGIRYVGMDVHKETVPISTVRLHDERRGPEQARGGSRGLERRYAVGDGGDSRA